MKIEVPTLPRHREAGFVLSAKTRLQLRSVRSDFTGTKATLHFSRSQRATDFGSNRTQVPMRNDGILPAFACLKIVILETVNMLASSSAVKARPIRSIRSGSDIGSAVLSWGLHDCIYLLSGFTSAATAAYCCRTVLHPTPVWSLKALS